ncbi:hypothetical protein PIB30_003533 [Stylosanthes scabra]|uniref:Uncharacterized protein n=1 Tax=Stylosanthes scabra TaxID=79078 RepID=A0ABU6W1T8_9FABA|nr:hypothetical protein [Stylosanthes scabra]
MNVNNFVVVTLYPNGEMGRDKDDIWFRFPTPVVFQMYPVVTLEELKSVILRNMGLGAVGTSLVRWIAYRLLNVFPPNPFKFKIFWIDSNKYVRALFDLHRSVPWKKTLKRVEPPMQETAQRLGASIEKTAQRFSDKFGLIVDPHPCWQGRTNSGNELNPIPPHPTCGGQAAKLMCTFHPTAETLRETTRYGRKS